jgi:excisionase family DNA binding protein
MNELLTVEEVARICGLSEWAIRRAIDDGELPASKLRSKWRIRPTDLEAWFESGLNQPRTEVASRNPLPSRRQKTRRERGGLRALNGSGKETA